MGDIVPMPGIAFLEQGDYAVALAGTEYTVRVRQPSLKKGTGEIFANIALTRWVPEEVSPWKRRLARWLGGTIEERVREETFVELKGQLVVSPNYDFDVLVHAVLDDLQQQTKTPLTLDDARAVFEPAHRHYADQLQAHQPANGGK